MRRRAGALLEATSPGLVAFALVLVVGCLALAGSASTQRAATQMLVMAVIVIGNWDAVTRGTQTMVGIPADLTIGTALPWRSRSPWRSS